MKEAEIKAKWDRKGLLHGGTWEEAPARLGAWGRSLPPGDHPAWAAPPAPASLPPLTRVLALPGWGWGAGIACALGSMVSQLLGVHTSQEAFVDHYKRALPP